MGVAASSAAESGVFSCDAGLDLTVPFTAGEEMRTEISTKFARQGLEGIYAEAGLELTDVLTDVREVVGADCSRATSISRLRYSESSTSAP